MVFLLGFPAFILDLIQDPAPDDGATIAVLGFALDEGPQLLVYPYVALVAFGWVAHALALRLSAMVGFAGVVRKYTNARDSGISEHRLALRVHRRRSSPQQGDHSIGGIWQWVMN
jgi:hypothetical protein